MKSPFLTTIIFTIIMQMSLQKSESEDFAVLKRIFKEMSKHYQKYTGKREARLASLFSDASMEAMIQPTEWSSETKVPGKEYDFIVVGSGSAGCVVANRLTEVPDWHVLLLEAGKGENLINRIPLLAPAFQLTHYDWQYLMEYDPGFARGMENRLLAWPRGRALGGTSVINYMIYTRGNPIDFDRWASNGNPGWSYQEVLPYFLKSENTSLRHANLNYHNFDGYFSTEDIYQSPLVKAFVRGGQELGFRQVDYTSADMFGFSTVQANTLKGRRHSAARAFLHPIRNRNNLHMYTSAYVTKILIDPNTRKAYGVEYVRKGKTIRAYAKKEVILSAGTFNSAQLLMLSGIGPKDHLEELGIPVLQDLPIGKKLYDHISYVGLAFIVNETVALSFDKLLDPKNINDYLVNGKGPYTSLGGVEDLGYIKTEFSDETADYPDIELIFGGISLATDYGVLNRRTMKIRDDVYNNLFAPLHGQHTWTIFPMLVHPKSVGYMKLRSKDPFQYPIFYGNYFTDPEDKDINTMVASIRFIMRLSETPAFQRYASKLNPIPVPGCEIYHFNSDDYWKCALRTLSITLHHQVATNKMGPPDDPESVVNHELKVYGVHGIRVADCSIIPLPITAHTNAPAIMVGEKAADLIKKDYAHT